MKEQAKIQCIHCDATRSTPMEKYSVGEILEPYPGGGNYGKCIRCKKPGMKVIEIPKTKPAKPVGWAKLPGM